MINIHINNSTNLNEYINFTHPQKTNPFLWFRDQFIINTSFNQMKLNADNDFNGDEGHPCLQESSGRHELCMGAL